MQIFYFIKGKKKLKYKKNTMLRWHTDLENKLKAFSS